MQPGSHGGGSFNDEEELIAAIEREVGPEAAEATRRSLRLASNSRALTDAERAELRANLEPVLQDMRSSGAIVPDIREEAHDDLGPDCVCAWIHSPGGVGSQGIRVQVSLFAPERLRRLCPRAVDSARVNVTVRTSAPAGPDRASCLGRGSSSSLGARRPDVGDRGGSAAQRTGNQVAGGKQPGRSPAKAQLPDRRRVDPVVADEDH